jgi:glycosyltransferase involved in cell wall biosynthesis
MKLSVITPSFGQGQFIERTIQSVLAQNDPDWEYVICDGGSTDQTLEILRDYGDHYPNLNWISEPDRGQADAINKGIAMTSGEIIAWINSDDIYYPAAFAAVRAVFMAHPEVQVIYGQADYIDEQDRVLEPYPTGGWNYQKLLENCYLCQPTVFFKRSLVEACGNLNQQLHYCLDYELWLRFGQQTNFYYLPQTLAGFRLYQDNKTLGQRTQSHVEAIDMIKSFLGYTPDSWLLRYARVKVEEDLSLDLTQPIHNRKFPITDLGFVSKFILTAIWAFWHWRKPVSPLRVANMLLPKAANWWLSPILRGNSASK